MRGEERQKRVNWSLRPAARAVVARAGNANGNGGRPEGAYTQGGYVSSIVEQRNAEWEAALEHLLGTGWKKREIREVVEKIPSPPAFTCRPSAHVGRAMDERVSEGTARAILIVAKEVAAGNAEVVGQL